MIIDTHAHYDDEAFDEDRELLLENLPNHNIEYVVNIAASIDSPNKIVDLVDKYPYIYGTVGIHPSDVKLITEETMVDLKEKAAHKKIVGIGEIGLDYYWDTSYNEIQKYWFDRQMSLAKEVELPIVVHSRDAAKDTYDLMRAAKAEDIGGVIHCFSYGKEEAKKYLDMGFYLGIGGVVTFGNSKKLKETVIYAPMDQLVLETDAPYLAPTPNRGSRNNSGNLIYVAETIATLKGVTLEEVIERTNQNAKQLYRKLAR